MFLGAVGGPKWDKASVRPEAGLLGLRRALDVYANLRPTRYLGLPTPLKEGLARHADILVVRELSSGVYFGEPRWEKAEEAVDTWRQTADEVRRVAHVAFKLARRRKKHVTSVDKANVLACSRLWRRVVTELAAEYPDVTLDHLYVDAASFEILRAPHRVRRDRHRQHVRRHPERRVGGTRGVDRRPPLGLARHRAGPLRAHPRRGARTSPARASPTRPARS